VIGMNMRSVNQS